MICSETIDHPKPFVKVVSDAYVFDTYIAPNLLDSVEEDSLCSDRTSSINEEEESEEVDSVVDQFEQIELVDENQAEIELMKAMGLPTAFASTKRTLSISSEGSDANGRHQARRRSKPKKGKKNKKRQVTNALDKYWLQRYRLFSRFDEGIKLDDESWYSVTPERIAEHIARRCIPDGTQSTVVIDGFCGAGGNAIQFVLASPHTKVIAIDIDPEKIALAQNNAAVYNCEHQIEFIVADFMRLAAEGRLTADLVFLSPPWGGPTYQNLAKYSLDMMTPSGVDIVHLIQQHITSNIALLCPRNIVHQELVELAGPDNTVEIERNFLNGKVKMVTAYYGSLVKRTDPKPTNEQE